MMWEHGLSLVDSGQDIEARMGARPVSLLHPSIPCVQSHKPAIAIAFQTEEEDNLEPQAALTPIRYT